jgi:hypothetical protein
MIASSAFDNRGKETLTWGFFGLLCSHLVVAAEGARNLDWQPQTIFAPATCMLLDSKQAELTTLPLSRKKNKQVQTR